MLDHRVRYPVCFGKQCAKTETRENVHVVTLARLEGLLPTEDWLVGRAGGKDDVAIGPTWPSQSAQGTNDLQRKGVYQLIASS